MKCYLQALTLIVVVCMGSGCVQIGTTFDEQTITMKSIRTMSVEECDIILLQATSTNSFYFDQDLKVFATPCTPRMLLAYNWKNRRLHHSSDEEYLENVDRQARNCLGASFDPIRFQFVDHHGHFINNISQLDSILLVFGIESAHLTHFPELSDLENKIAFRVGGEKVSEPLYVRGHGMKYLTLMEQDYVAMFPVTEKMKSYLSTHESIELYIDLDSYTARFPVRFIL